MTTGTGLVLFGIWVTTAVTWGSRLVPGVTAVVMTAIAITLTFVLR